MIRILTLFALIGFVGCASNSSHSIQNLKEATDHWAVLSGAVDFTDKDGWPSEIKALNPIEIYTDRVNIVIATELKDSIETGYYVYIPISSYLPQNNTEWTFSSQGDSVWTYTRNRCDPVDSDQ